MGATKLYASWEAAKKLGTTRKMLWYYQSKGYIEGTEGNDGFPCYAEEQIANAKLPAVVLRRIAEKRALQERNATEPTTDEPEDIQCWASQPWREYESG